MPFYRVVLGCIIVPEGILLAGSIIFSFTSSPPYLTVQIGCEGATLEGGGSCSDHRQDSSACRACSAL